MKMNNKGMSLVELLIAICIAAAVSLLIATMMTQSTSMFREESENIDVQNELQIVQNQLTTRFMEAKEIHLVKAGDDVRVYTGAVDPTTNLLQVEGTGTSYTDSIISYKDGKLYITNEYKKVEDIPKGYLLSDKVTSFDVEIANDAIETTQTIVQADGSVTTVTKYHYESPISVKITMDIGKGDKTKNADMVVKIRNDIEVFNIYSLSDIDAKIGTVVPEKLTIKD